MIGSTTRGGGFRGVLEYVFGSGKLDKPDRATLLGGTLIGRNPRELAKEFGGIRAMRPECKNPVKHISFSIPEGEHLTPEKWLKVGFRIANTFGYDAWALVGHDDKSHEDVHFVGSRITKNGEIIRETMHDFERTESVCREMEKEFGLRQVESPERLPSGRKKPDLVKRVTRNEQKMIDRTGMPSWKVAIQSAAIEVLQAKPVSIEAFELGLSRLGIDIKKGIKKGQLSGLTYIHRETREVMKGIDLGDGFKGASIVAIVAKNHEEFQNEALAARPATPRIEPDVEWGTPGELARELAHGDYLRDEEFFLQTKRWPWDFEQPAAGLERSLEPGGFQPGIGFQRKPHPECEVAGLGPQLIPSVGGSSPQRGMALPGRSVRNPTPWSQAGLGAGAIEAGEGRKLDPDPQVDGHQEGGSTPESGTIPLRLAGAEGPGQSIRTEESNPVRGDGHNHGGAPSNERLVAAAHDAPEGQGSSVAALSGERAGGNEVPGRREPLESPDTLGQRNGERPYSEVALRPHSRPPVGKDSGRRDPGRTGPRSETGLILLHWDKRVLQPAALDLCDLKDLAEHQAVAFVQKLGPPVEAAFGLVGQERGLTSMSAVLAHGVEPNLRVEAVARVMLWARAVWDKATGLFLPREYREARERLHDRELTDFRPIKGDGPVVIMDGREMPMAQAVERALRPSLRIVVPEMPAPAPTSSDEPRTPLKKPLKMGGKSIAYVSGGTDDGFLRRQEARETPIINPNGSGNGPAPAPAPASVEPTVKKPNRLLPKKP